MKNRHGIKWGKWAMTGLFLSASGGVLASPLAVTNTFQANTPATAASVNQNFTDVENAVNDNDTRINTNTGDIADNFNLINDNAADIDSLESGIRPGDRTFINVDCDANPDVLQQPPYTDNFYPYTTFIITGDCNGPFYLESDGIRIVGAEPNRGASIVLPASAPVPGDGAVFADGAHDVRLENLTVDASAWGTFAVAGGTDAAGIYLRNAFMRVKNVDIIGGLYGANPFRNSILRFEGTVNITEFVNAGLSVGDHSQFNSRGQVNISTTRTDGTNYIIGVETYRQGIVDFRAGVNVTMPAADFDNNIFPMAITNGSQSTLQIRNSGSNNINGTVGLFSSSRASINGMNLTGELRVDGSSQAQVSNSTQTGGNVSVGSDNQGGSSLSVWNSTIATNAGNDDDIDIGPLSTMTISDSNAGHGVGGEIYIRKWGLLTVYFGTNLNNTDVGCDTAGSFDDFGASNVGTINGC